MELLDLLEGAIAAAVVDKNELKVGVELGSDLLDGVIKELEDGLFVVTGDNDGE